MSAYRDSLCIASNCCEITGAIREVKNAASAHAITASSVPPKSNWPSDSEEVDGSRPRTSIDTAASE